MYPKSKRLARAITYVHINEVLRAKGSAACVPDEDVFAFISLLLLKTTEPCVISEAQLTVDLHSSRLSRRERKNAAKLLNSSKTAPVLVVDDCRTCDDFW